MRPTTWCLDNIRKRPYTTRACLDTRLATLQNPAWEGPPFDVMIQVLPILSQIPSLFHCFAFLSTTIHLDHDPHSGAHSRCNHSSALSSFFSSGATFSWTSTWYASSHSRSFCDNSEASMRFFPIGHYKGISATSHQVVKDDVLG